MKSSNQDKKSQTGKFSSRRKFIQTGLKTLGAGSVTLLEGGSQKGQLLFLPGLSSVALGQSQPQRLVHIYLRGGASFFSFCDPPVSAAKQASSAFADYFKNQSTATVAGKSALQLGAGLIPASTGLAMIPTAFVNGVDAKNVVHDIGQNYALGGIFSLSTANPGAALAARLGSQSTVFPYHIVLGSKIPLGDTATDTPPMLASGGIADLFTRKSYNSAQDRMATALQSFNQIYLDQKPETVRNSLATWNQVSAQLTGLDSQNYGSRLLLSDDQYGRYGSQYQSFGDILAILKSGLSQYITYTIGGFDTHVRETSDQLRLQISVATGLNHLIQDLASTPDPADASKMLLETTTIMINSEFGRTPQLNGNSGTDHWEATSVLLLGQHIRDNTVVGSTDANGHALGWENGTAVARTQENSIHLEDIFAGLLRKMGQTADAEGFSTTPLMEVFS